MQNDISRQYGFKQPMFFLTERRLKGCESNVSRIARLCWKYGIPPTIFFNEFLKVGAPVNRNFFQTEVAVHLNSYSNKTVEYEKVLNQLLGAEQDKCYSYSYLNNVMDMAGHGFLDTRKKWCPACYRDRLIPNESQNGIFDDLYWSVEVIKTCLLHGYSLRNKCSRCFSYQPYISTTVEPGYCHNCLAFLGETYECYAGDEELEVQRQLFTLFYLDTYEEVRPNFVTLTENLKALRQAFPDATSKYLGDAMGVSDDVVKKWLSGRRKPRLETLFSLQKVLGLFGPHQLFYKTEMFINKVLLAKSLALKFNTRSPFAGMVKDREIREEFENMLAGQVPTISRSDLAQQFEVSEGFLMSRYSILCEQLSIAHAARLEYERELRNKNIVEQFTISLGRVRSRKKTWTVANVIGELNDPTIIIGLSEVDLVLPFEKAKVKLREQDEVRRSKKNERKWAKTT